MWTLLLALAIATPPVELASELPKAQGTLEICARLGCDRAEGARAAWIVALGTYVEGGAADGVMAATVRELDPTLFADLPKLLQESATEPLPWASRVGGVVYLTEPQPTPTSIDPDATLKRVAAVRSEINAQRSRIFVLDASDSLHYDDEKLDRELSMRIGRPNAIFYPAGDLCQQAELRTEASLDSREPLQTEGNLCLERQGVFDTLKFAREYQLRVGGVEFVISSPLGVMKTPAGDHQIWLVREDGVGPVLEAHPGVEEFRVARDEADACIAKALEQGPEAIGKHFERLAARLPGADLYIAVVDGKRAKDAQLWTWTEGHLVQVDSTH